MSHKVYWLVGIVVLVSSCADQRWPGQANDLANAGDYPIVEKRYESASKKSLGTTKDIVDIKKAILKSHPEMNIDEIRWLSASEVITYVDRGRNLNLGYESFYFVLDKTGEEWRVIAWYMDEIS